MIIATEKKQNEVDELGLFPLIAAVLSSGVQMYQQRAAKKKAQKEAKRQEEAAAKEEAAARQKEEAEKKESERKARIEETRLKIQKEILAKRKKGVVRVSTTPSTVAGIPLSYILIGGAGIVVIGGVYLLSRR